MMSPLSQDTLTTAEAAELLRVHKNTVLDLAKYGEIPCRKVGRQWRFSRSALQRWIQGQVKKTP